MSNIGEGTFRTERGDTMTDKDIIELYFARSEDAIRKSEEKYGAYCRNIANNILHDSEDAKECVNDTWLGAWNSIPPKRPDSLKLYLASITRNSAYNRYRAGNADKRGKGEICAVLDELEGVIASTDTEAQIEGKALAECINNFLARLDVRERSIFIRRYYFVESSADIAARYSMSRANVLTVLSRTRKKLKKHLKEEKFTV